MRIVFLNPCAPKKLSNDGGEICYGISIISACLKEAGHDCDLIQIVGEYSDKDIAGMIKAKGDADVYAFQYLSHFRKTMERWSRVIRSVSSAKIVCGGASAVIEPETAMSIPEMDAVCIGEGEFAMVAYAKALAVGALDGGLENFWIRKSDGSIAKGEVSRLIEDINKLPFFDMSLYDLDNIRPMKLRIPCVHVLLSRGCPYSCTYCANNNAKKAYKGKGRYFRFLEPRRAIEDIKNIVAGFKTPTTLSFVDDTFNFDLKWLESFCEIYKKEIKLPFKAMGRGDHITPRSAQVMKEAGCIRFVIGVESGNPDLRKNLLNRFISDEQFLAATKALHDAGIQVQTSNICGFPDETKADMLSTIRLNAMGRVDFPTCGIFWPFRNTDIFKLCIEKGCIKEDFDEHIERIPTFFENSILNFPDDFKRFLRFNSKAFPMLVHIYRSFLDFPAHIGAALISTFEDAYLNGRIEKLFPEDSMLRHTREFENALYKDMEIPLLEEIEREYGMRFPEPEIVGRRAEPDSVIVGHSKPCLGC